MPLDSLLPRHRVTWVLWVSILVAIFPLYYVLWPYPRLNVQYEKERWVECEWDGRFCGEMSLDSERRRELYVRAPAYVADFTEMPLQVRVTNIYTETLDAVVGVSVVRGTERRVHIRLVDRGYESVATEEHDVAGYEQNSVTLPGIPPNGEMVATFMIRVSGGSEGEVYTATMLLDGKPTPQPIEYQSTFDRQKVFQMWLIKHLLFPPGANIFIPIVSLLIVCFGEEVYESVTLQRLNKRMLWLLILLFIPGALPILFIVWTPLGWFFLAAMLLSAVVGCWIGRGGKPPRGREPEGSLPPISEGEKASEGEGRPVSLGASSKPPHQEGGPGKTSNAPPPIAQETP